jgi:hypothetical protein
MATEQTVLNIMARALWDPHPTVNDDKQAQYLAAALGYPPGWRVLRTVTTTATPETLSKDAENATTTTSQAQPHKLIVADVICAGHPSSGCDTWFHHEAAMEAAADWVANVQNGTDDTTDNNNNNDTPVTVPCFHYKGGHLLPRKPLYDKGDKVQVLYEGAWWDAKIVRRKEYTEGFRYQVAYPVDNSKQSGVNENLIRPLVAVAPQVAEQNAALLASQLGFGEGWLAYCKGKNKWKVIDPSGVIFTSKRAALEAYANENKAKSEEGDPPWRTTGHDLIGRSIVWKTNHVKSARRTVTIEQIGTVTGWISETDVDQAGQPGYVSEKTGQPARLFHVVFDDNPTHSYALTAPLVSSQDLEEFEVLECLLPEVEVKSPAKKKARR